MIFAPLTKPDLTIALGLLNIKDPAQKIYPPKIKGINLCILQGWMGLFFSGTNKVATRKCFQNVMEQIKNLLQISPVPNRSHF